MSLNILYTTLTLLLTFIPLLSFNGYFNKGIAAVIQLLIIAIIVINKKKFCIEKIKPISIYFKVTIVQILVGYIISDNYWDYKRLLIGTISCSIPIFAWIGYNPNLLLKILRIWYKYVPVLTILFFGWFFGIQQNYLSPLLLLFCFFPLFPKKKRVLIFIIGILYCIGNIETRSQIAKGGAALIIGFLCMNKNLIKPYLIKFYHLLSYSSIIIIFGLLLSNLFSYYKGNIVAEEAKTGDSHHNSDSRSLIYIDVIDSSISNNYYLLGRTPSRGNDVVYSQALFFWAYDDVEIDKMFYRDQRHKNEVVLLNIFTWQGLIGLFLFSLIYFRATYLAVYKSKNTYISLLGCYIAFRWVCGWIEDINDIDILNFSLWSMIGMCFSHKFRAMNNNEFKEWITKII